MAFVKIKQALIPHFSELQRQPAAFHAKVIRKLLAGERNVEFIAAPALRLGGKIGHQLCARRALAHVGELFVEPQVLLCQFAQQIADDPAMVGAGGGAHVQNASYMQKHHRHRTLCLYAHIQYRPQRTGEHLREGLPRPDFGEDAAVSPDVLLHDEGAIAMVDGKAQLMRDDYCDGLGDCLPTCPTGAITFVEREAAAYDEQAVMENKQRKMRNEGMTLPCGCPGSQSRNIQREAAPAVEVPQTQQTSRLSQWPVQIKLVPVNAPYFDGARLLIAADCTAYAYAAFHERFIKGHITLVGCPKLDSVDYAEKLTEILRENDIKSVTVVRMEVPCCGGLELAAKKALQQSGKFIPWQVVTVTVDGRLKED